MRFMEPSKRCCTCHLDQPLSAFNKRAAATDGLQARCRDCSSRWYEVNRAEHKANVRKRNERVRVEWQLKLALYLSEHPCVDCGERDVRCLEFDHLDAQTKLSNVTRMVANAMPWTTVLAEIEKCDVRCANCHRRVTAERGGWWRQAIQERVQADLAAETHARLDRVFQPRNA
jgi:hypothetical protein